jgi:hypothetical protein
MIEPLRTCKVCGKKAYSEKDLELFMKAARAKYGRENLCDRCSANKVMLQYRKNPQPSKERLKTFRAKHPEAHRKDVSEDRRKHPERHNARNRIYAHQIPLAQACVQCGSKENLHHHHPDYSKPFEVITLCRACHGLIHRKPLKTSPNVQGGSR